MSRGRNHRNGGSKIISVEPAGRVLEEVAHPHLDAIRHAVSLSVVSRTSDRRRVDVNGEDIARSRCGHDAVDATSGTHVEHVIAFSYLIGHNDR
jgi:hypothetical protein